MNRGLPNARATLQAARAGGELPLGLIVGSPDPAITELLAVSGFDFVILDNEHAPMEPDVALNHVRAAEAAGIVPMVRVGETRQAVVQKFLDVGCQGVVFPRVESVEQAEQAAAMLRFAPRGTRGMCPSCHGAWFGAHDWDHYSRASEAETLCIVLIESDLGVQNVEEIAAVDGVDVLFLGPGDLSQEYGDGTGWLSPRTRDAWSRVRSAAERTGVLTMTAPHPDVSAEAVHGLFDDGADMIVYSADWVLIRQSFQRVAALKQR